jgi:hypothetical protein
MLYCLIYKVIGIKIQQNKSVLVDTTKAIAVANGNDFTHEDVKHAQ